MCKLNSPRALLLFVVANCLSLGPASATNLGEPQYFAIAKNDLKKGTILTATNIVVSSATDSEQIPRGSMWLSDPGDVYGFALQDAVTKDSPISGHALIHHMNDYTIGKTDALWQQYAKASIACDKRHEFEKSRQYDAGTLTELIKLAQKKQRLTCMDDENLLFTMLNHQEEANNTNSEAEARAEGSRYKPAAFTMDLDKLKEQAKEISAQREALKKESFDRASARLARAQKVYPVVAGVLPANCQVVRFAKQELAEATRSFAAEKSH